MSEALVKDNSLAIADDRELIKAIAWDIGCEVAAHIEIMYPAAVKAASSTFLLSVKGCVTNEIMAAIESKLPAEKRLKFNKAFRRKQISMYRKIRKERGVGAEVGHE